MSWQFEEEELVDVLEDEQEDEGRTLVVFNDEVNSFDHVIETLVKVCKHERHQAEQCTYIIHFKGKCLVKKGTYDMLKPMREGIVDAGINAVIN
ncbi:ATP-dependent Clp protease adaptor ClpS [Reichenbachiella carrageenanivorans]|uniref:ATP-dependent Clp protease adaptor ClpS n=1 Tax=Reichenbachiella carrageenanivorans TaxID=2979869 RepID=A0ABY6CY77_9BACT|nr:ATP-dependent Clp protease adaptor ClpS [Reichenbachiella carrageenanivorans]UXX78334.1 ATP-dependent Clp protease adaptor ClpS [Reichenbachiella carrageenanivorans]